MDADGVVKLDELEAAIRPDTILISVMAANTAVRIMKKKIYVWDLRLLYSSSLPLLRVQAE